MAESSYQIRGRLIDRDDLVTIRGMIATHWDKGRSAISQELCEQWSWYQANGRLKDRACRVLLLKLEEKCEITLPPRKKDGYKYRGQGGFQYDSSPLTSTVSKFSSLTITLISRTQDEPLWNYLLDQHHYLGNPGIVGNFLKYFVFLDGRLVACLGWGSAAWQVASRDHFIGGGDGARQANLHRVVNNVRFLILPWVNVRHLASKLLAHNCHRLRDDWYAMHRQPVSLLETFVDTSRFQGTCYRAANWLCVGHQRPWQVRTEGDSAGKSRVSVPFVQEISGGAPWLRFPKSSCTRICRSRNKT